MRDETRRRLEQRLLLQRLKWVGAAGAGVAGVAALLLLTDLDAHLDNRHVAGVVEHVAPGPAKAAQNGLAVDVVLDDGRRVQVLALKTTDPHVGDRVDIVEHHHGTGRVTFTWK